MCSRLKVLHKRNAVLQLMFLFLARSTVGDRLTEASSRYHTGVSLVYHWCITLVYHTGILHWCITLVYHTI